MNDLQTFDYHDKAIRTIIKNDEPWFVARDVCSILDINISQTRRLDDDEKELRPTQTPGGSQQLLWVNEPGLYSLIIGSNKPEAKQFKRWITHEVIPSVRKHGAYMTPETIEKVILNPDFIINLAGRLKEEQQKRIEAESIIEKQEPLVLFAKTCASSKDTILIRELAKLVSDEGINIGQNRLYEKLREWGYIIKGRTEPTQRAMDLKYFDVSQRVIQSPFGAKIKRTTKVTPKGQIKIIERLKKEFSDSKSAGVYFETS